jgi:long-chain acyl-CoA synthetase
MNLTSPIRRTALEHPERVAVVDGAERVTYREIWSALSRCAARLRREGLRPGDRVVVWVPNGAPFLAAHLGAMAAGLISVPVKAENGPVELGVALADSRARVLIAGDGVLDRLPAGVPEGVRVIAAGDLMGEEDGDAEPEEVEDGHPASAIYSYFFGEGRPYAAVLTHGNHLFAAGHCGPFHCVDGDSRVLVVLPMLHVFAMGVAILPSLYTGGAIHVGRSVRPRTILETISSQRITHLPGVPHVLESLARFHDPARYDLSSIHHLISGADFLPAEVHRRIEETLQVPLVQGYGLTECFPAVCNPPDARNRPGTLGIAGNPRIAYRATDDEGRELPPGGIGEIEVRSPGVMSGYLDAPEATDRVLRDGWLRSGDLGWVDADGYLHFHALRKPILNLFGNKVDPIEVARTLERLPGVAAAEVAVEHRANGHGLFDPVLRARLTAEPGAQVRDADVRAHCRAWLAPYKVPSEIEIV